MERVVATAGTKLKNKLTAEERSCAKGRVKTAMLDSLVAASPSTGVQHSRADLEPLADEAVDKYCGDIRRHNSGTYFPCFMGPRAGTRTGLCSLDRAGRIVALDIVLPRLVGELNARIHVAGGHLEHPIRPGDEYLNLYSLTDQVADAKDEPPEQWPADGFLYVWLKARAEHVPWVVVGPSAALASIGHTGRGVYAWGGRTGDGFKKGELIGVYAGEVYGPADDPRLKEKVALLPSGYPYDALLEVGGYIVDGRESPYKGKGFFNAYNNSQVSWPGMYAHLMNDPRGLPDGKFIANVCVTEPHGVVETLRPIPPFDPEDEDNHKSELLWVYDGSYWDKEDEEDEEGEKQGGSGRGGGKRRRRSRGASR